MSFNYYSLWILFFLGMSSISLAENRSPFLKSNTAARSQSANTDVHVEGVVTQFDEQTITLKQNHGVQVRIPRSSYPVIQGVIVGKTVIKTKLSSTDFLKLNHKLFSKRKSKK